MCGMKKIKTQQRKDLQMMIGAERRSWNGLNPVTRVVQSKKSYNRNREKRGLREIKESED